MVFITEELIRKRSEHNEGIISTLEELSLHQENIEKIEHLNNWCKKLQILLLQANQISKIENLNKLKELQYLNLAINNIERIENLERCESLEKLDLTLNFIGDLESVKNLKDNLHLKNLYLTGNPCCDFKGYREYVIANLPQLKTLDMLEITRSERIKALQNLIQAENDIKKAQAKYARFRYDQKERLKSNNSWKLTDEEFWQTASENSPETRIDISRRKSKSDNTNKDVESIKKTKKIIRLFDQKTNKPLNVNEAKLKFTFSDKDAEKFILDLAIYKYLDTNLIEIDVQPNYVKIMIKGKIFQLVIPEEVHVEKSNALRSQTTGHLMLNLVKLNYKAPLLNNNKPPKLFLKNTIAEKNSSEYLEVTEKLDEMDFSKIIEKNSKKKPFIDNPEVPLLEYAN